MKKQTFSALIFRMNLVFILSVSIISVGYATDPTEGIGGKKKKSEKEIPETPSLKKRFIAELIAGGYLAPCPLGDYSKRGMQHHADLVIVESNGHITMSSGSLLKLFADGELKAERDAKKYIFKSSLLQPFYQQLSDGEYYKITRSISVSITLIAKNHDFGLDLKTPVGAGADSGFNKLNYALSMNSSFFNRNMPLSDLVSHLGSPADFCKQVIMFWSSLPDDLIVLPEVIEVTDEF